MVVHHRGAHAHALGRGADADHKRFGCGLVGGRLGQIVAVQPAHAVIGLCEHLDHNVHFVRFGAVQHLGNGTCQQVIVAVAVLGECAGQLLLAPGELVAARLTHGVEPFHELRALYLEQGLVVPLASVGLQELDSHVALGVAPVASGLLEHAQAVLPALDIHVGGVKAVEQARELIEKVVVHRCEQVGHHVCIGVDGGIGNALLEHIGTRQPRAGQHVGVENSHLTFLSL